MPELPEVETVRRALAARLPGRVISSCGIIPPGFNQKAPPSALRAVVGARVQGVSRRGKYLVLKLSNGHDLTMHLGMSGRIILDKEGPHARFFLRAEGVLLTFLDPRRFGRVACPLPRLGPEPLSAEFTPEALFRAFKKSRAGVKTILMDQSVVAGLGNIYATEALFTAGIRPQRRGETITSSENVKLHRAIRRVLTAAVKSGGSTLDDESFLDPTGRPGKFQRFVNVYGRKTGRSCGHALKKTPKPMAGRTSLYCPSCQK